VSAGSLRRKAWDDALLVLLVDRPGLGGEALLVAIIQEANDALTRLREHGMIEAER
jgi:hypothetical protein